MYIHNIRKGHSQIFTLLYTMRSYLLKFLASDHNVAYLFKFLTSDHSVIIST